MTARPSGVQLDVRLRRSKRFRLNIDVQLPGSGVTAILGPSGCGKTTLLRCIAGLSQTTHARVVVNDDVWQDDARGIYRRPHCRPVGYVFQEASLFSHLTVQGNLDFGLRRTPVQHRRVSLSQAIDLLGIEHLLNRRPAQLSGGERQRVAIARALATSPDLLLMDEPLASLDVARKEELLPYFARLTQSLDIPMIYVTHSLDEVARLAHHLLLMDRGEVTQQGAPSNLLARLDVAQQQGDAAGVLLEGVVTHIDSADHLLQVRLGGGELIYCLPPTHHISYPVGQPIRLRIQARDVSLALKRAQHTSILNILPATIESMVAENPAQTLIALQLNSETLLARITTKSARALGLHIGQKVHAQIKGAAIWD